MKLLLPPLSIALLLGATKAQATSADQFEPWQTIGYTSAGPQDFSAGVNIASADLDGDGLRDVVFSGKQQGALFSAVWKGINDGNGGFSLSLAHIIANPIGAFVAAHDMDLDGDVDVLVARLGGGGDDRLLWLENAGDGTFGTQHVLAASTSPSTPWDMHEVHICDLDGDGVVDELIRFYGRSGSPAVLELFEKQPPSGGGSWSFAGTLPSIPSTPRRFLPAMDWNQDGHPDMTARSGALLFVSYFNLAIGSFDPWVSELNGPLDGDFAPYDWNGDGRMDLVLADGDFWYLAYVTPTNPAGLRFGMSAHRPWIIQANDSCLGIAIADLDNDGQLECIHRSSQAGLSLGLHASSSTVSSGGYIPTPSEQASWVSQQILCIDHDGDGDLDIFLGGEKPGFCRNQRDAVEVLGSGCAGVSLESSYAHQGQNWILTMSGVPATSSVGVFIFGNLPVNPAFPLGNSGCSVHTNGVFQSLTAPRQGSFTVLSMAIPTHPAVLGYSFTAQAATAAPGTPLGFALTNGITATVLR